MVYIAHNVTVKGDSVSLRMLPKCYYCGAVLPKSIAPLVEGYTSNSLGPVAEHGTYYLLLKCPYCECIKTYLFSINTDRHNRNHLNSYGTMRKQVKKNEETNFPDQISSISPRFVSIYSQSYQAERKGLDELTGMGYRKALEFLVKDYAIYKFPNQKEQIMKHSLQSAMKTVDTHEIKVLGQVSAKIGNDETHYYRKHEWKISELKNYIESIVFFITSDLNYDEADRRLSEDRNSKQG